MGFRGGLRVKKLMSHPNELLIWAYPENLVKIRLLVEAVGNFLWDGTGRGWHGTGTLVII